MGNFLTVKITRNKKNKYYTQQIQNLSTKHTFVLSKETERIIKEKIRESIKRPGSTGTLAEAFETYTTLNGHGVGKISYLNKVVPYWRHQDAGSEAIGANWRHRVPSGQFSPGEPKPDSSSFQAGRWSEGGKYGFIPTQPIPAKNYIIRTLAEILPNIQNILRTIK